MTILFAITRIDCNLNPSIYYVSIRCLTIMGGIYCSCVVCWLLWWSFQSNDLPYDAAPWFRIFDGPSRANLVELGELGGI